MKSAIVYYSYSGNTHKITQIIGEILKNKGDEVVPVRIRPLKEEKNFFMQCVEAALSKKPKIYRTLLDLKDFDRIILGSPVWVFKPAPAINTYLDKCYSLEGKTGICFVTYGSGAGKDKALSVMKKALAKKGAKITGDISFQQNDSEEKCRQELEKILS